MTTDYDYQRLLDRLDSLDARYGNMIAYCKRIEARVEELERELGLQGDEIDHESN